VTLLTRRWQVLKPHATQAEYWASPHRFNVVPAGRRSGKTELAKRKLVTRLLEGTAYDNPRFFAAAPTRDQAKKIYWEDLKRLVPPWFKAREYEGDLIIRTITDAELHVLGMDKPARIEGQPWDGGVLDEYGNMKKDAWEANVRPALSDRKGWCDFVGVPEDGSAENHYKMLWDKAVAEMAEKGDASDWGAYTWFSSTVLDAGEVASAKADMHPSMFAQEYEGSWVSWAGTKFFSEDLLLESGLPVDYPITCDCVFATLDCAMKDGKAHDGMGIVYWALIQYDGRPRLVILDWDYVQINVSLLDDWFPSVLNRLQEFCNQFRVIRGSIGAFVEDTQAGTVIIQKAPSKNWPVHAIESKLTSMGKDSRAFAVSGYVASGRARVSRYAYEKTVAFKGERKNHLLSQVTSYIIGDPNAAKRADDLFDGFTYGPLVALGTPEGF